jgi:hypothetical protein
MGVHQIGMHQTTPQPRQKPGRAGTKERKWKSARDQARINTPAKNDLRCQKTVQVARCVTMEQRFVQIRRPTGAQYQWFSCFCLLWL